MKRVRSHISTILIAVIFCCCNHAVAQMKLGDNKTIINPNSLLELESTNKGLLLPRMGLSATTNPAPMTAFVQGMFIFNTTTVADVTPGIYFSDGTRWVKVTTDNAANNNWSLTGNAGTNAATNFLGTTDNNPLLIKTNNTERLRVDENGRVGIGTATPQATLQVKGQVIIDTLTAGNKATDSLLVADPANGRVKMISASAFLTAPQKTLQVVAATGQVIFTTPAAITDVNKIMLYRNGVTISFTQAGSNSIQAEIASVAGDEIRIIQFL